MDNLTHGLFGAVLSRTGLNRKTGLATLTLVLANEAPDIDIVVRFFSRVEYFAHHRGFTHTFVGVPFMAALVLAVVYAIYGIRRHRGWQPKLPPRWKLLYSYAVFGTLTHIGFDFLNNYGVRPLSPFVPRWFAWDIVSIIEPLMILPLALALVSPWFLGLIGSEIGVKKQRFRGRGAAVTALIFMVALWWFRDFQHRRAVALLEDEVFGGSRAVRFSVNPYPITPFRWHGAAETETAFVVVQVNTFIGAVNSQGNAMMLYKPEETMYSLAAKKSRLGQVYLDWARHPYTQVRLREDGSALVLMRDLRYAYPDSKLRILVVSFEVDKSGKVVAQNIGWPPD